MSGQATENYRYFRRRAFVFWEKAVAIEKWLDAVFVDSGDSL